MSNKLNSLIQQAETLRSQNNLTAAMDVYRKICKIDKNNVNAWMAYGAVAGNLGKLAAAESAFRRACSIQGAYGKQHELLIQALDVQGKYGEALKILLKLRKTGHSPPDILLKIGLFYGKNKDFNNSITTLEQYVNAGNVNGFAYHCLASAHESLNNFNEAEKYYKHALELLKSDYQLHNNYGGFLQNRGAIEDAIAQYTNAIRINGQYPLAWHNLGNAYLKTGRYDLALAQFTTACNLKPDYQEAIIGSGKCHYAVASYMLAIETFKKAVSINDKSSDALANLGLCYSAIGDLDSAFEMLERASTIDADNIEIKCSLAMLHEKNGNFHDAESIVKPLLDTAAPNVDVVIAYATLCKHLGECNSALEMIDRCLIDEAVSPILKTSLHYKAGKILDSCKEYDKAFSHYQSANDLETFTYNESASERSLDNIKTLFPADSMHSLAIETQQSPIFILGMPRSGTTLVEQILASHPEVFGAGELPYLGNVANALCGQLLSGEKVAQGALSVEGDNLQRLADEYIENSRTYSGNELFVTDKMPHNFRLIGLINILFPNARIIHCIRNPIDNCLSIYFSHFNALHPYASKLQDIANYYSNYYQKLMKYWEETSKINVLNVIYEDLVDDQAGVTSSMLDYCGLEWNDKCLDFHKSGRVAATISYDQVRQPIYSKSKQRWKNYAAHIRPLLDHFQDFAV